MQVVEKVDAFATRLLNYLNNYTGSPSPTKSKVNTAVLLYGAKLVTSLFKIDS